MTESQSSDPPHDGRPESQILAAAIAHHEAGRIQAAEHLYRAVLALQGQHAQANQLLGMLEVESGQVERGLEHLQRALEIDPENGGYWLSFAQGLLIAKRPTDALAVIRRAQAMGLDRPEVEELIGSIEQLLAQAEQNGESTDRPGNGPLHAADPEGEPELSAARERLSELIRAGDFEAAEDAARQLVAADPNEPAGWKVLGILLGQKGRFEAAMETLGRALELSPSDAECLNALGYVLQHQGRAEDARAHFHRALESQPSLVEALINLGRLEQDLGRWEEAAQAYRRAVSLRPDYAKAHNHLGLALRGLGRLEEARAACERALQLRPDLAEAHNNLGILLAELALPDGALKHYRRALEIRPDDPVACSNLGHLLREMGRLDESLDCLRAGASRHPASAEIRNGLGLCLQDAGKMREALDSFEQASAMRSDYAESDINRGNVLRILGRIDEALACYARALKKAPDDLLASSNLLFTLNYQPSLTPRQVFEQHRAFDREQASRIAPLPPVSPDERDPDQVLRLGLVSGDLRQHSVAFFLLPLVERLDPGQFEIFFYSRSQRQDDWTRAFKVRADGWLECAKLDQRRLAERIRADRIDILLDLSGHTRGNALLAFAARPAPLQVSWLGYPNTTGLQAMDYRLVDPLTDPPGESDRYHTECLIRLPEGFLCYRPGDSGSAVEVTAPPSEASGRITFGSFNLLGKLSSVTLDLWARVLASVPNSRLLLKSNLVLEPSAWDGVLAHLAGRGVDSQRIEILPFAGFYSEHLSTYRQVDIALDPFPYHGTTTTCEALFMGVPVVTLAGDRHVSRVGVSLLNRVGLPDLVAGTPAEYVRIAADLAGDLDRLRPLRAGLRDRIQKSALRDEMGFTRAFEAVLRKMWRLWCSGEAPHAFELGGQAATQGSKDPKREPPRMRVRPSRGKRESDRSRSQGKQRAARPVRPGGRPSASHRAGIPSADGKAVTELFEQARYAEAEAAARRLTERYPDAMFGWMALGTILVKTERYEEALPLLLEANRVSPGHKDCMNALGYALLYLGRVDEAVGCFKRSLEIDPEYALAHNNLGTAYKELGRLDEALECFERAIASDPDYAEAYCNKGIALDKRGLLDDSIECLQKALAIQPAYAEAYNNLGNTYKNKGCLQDALHSYRQALKIKPGLTQAHNNLLFCMNYLDLDSREQVFAEHQSFERQQAGHIARMPSIEGRERDPEKVLRVGFLSGDFRQHSVSFFLLPVLENLDRGRFEVWCYSRGYQRDHLTKVFRDIADGWVDCVGMQEQALAERIRGDAIDLLVDLSGHTDGNALLACAAKPAPVQINWIGYPNTTGLSAMDYRLVDAITDPVGESDAYHTESLIRLPRGFLCYRPLESVAGLPIGPPPSLEAGRTTFGSFNNLAKLSESTLDLWARILLAVPDARLLLKTHTAADLEAWNRSVERFRQQGVHPDRVEVLSRAPSLAEHLTQYQGVDIALDSFPYHGTTTTCEAFFMGVPVVTLMGDRHAARVGASLLTRVDLTELIAGSPDEYVRIAKALAADRGRLAALRSELRERLAQSPLRDELGFTRTLEEALRQMWLNWCSGAGPEAFDVTWCETG